MKRLLSFLLVLIMVLTCVPALANPYKVTSDNGVNVRDLPGGSESQIIGVKRFGEVLEVVEMGKYWAKIVYKGGYAYVYKDYIVPVCRGVTLPKKTQKQTQKPVIVNNYRAQFIGIATDTAYVRPLSDLNKTIGTIRAGEIVYIVSRGKYWSKVVYNNSRMGYFPTDKFIIIDVNLSRIGTLYRVKRSSNGSYTAVNIREKPDKNSKLLETIEVGHYVKVIGKDVTGKWYQVIYNAYGNTGYIRSTYLVNGEHDKIFFK